MTHRLTLAQIAAACSTEGAVRLPLPTAERGHGTFAEPWQAQAFAMTLLLHERGVFTWTQWARALAAQIPRAQAQGDCDDGTPEVHAGAPELCNERDDDCDDAVDEAPAQTWCSDADADGFGDPGDGIHACAQPSRYIDECTDCDDDDATVGGGCGGA